MCNPVTHFHQVHRFLPDFKIPVTVDHIKLSFRFRGFADTRNPAPGTHYLSNINAIPSPLNQTPMIVRITKVVSKKTNNAWTVSALVASNLLFISR